MRERTGQKYKSGQMWSERDERETLLLDLSAFSKIFNPQLHQQSCSEAAVPHIVYVAEMRPSG